uniref:Condensin-2 complex subunit H2 n=1 Tax=Spermophilus dauricus TaxID=99837 RepID=A0A8C9PKL5_SPEDA
MEPLGLWCLEGCRSRGSRDSGTDGIRAELELLGYGRWWVGLPWSEWAQTGPWLPWHWCCFLQLDQICISFDEGKTTMNFIEAALLIQGSACVYSKKVEYLYSLVYQALDFISGKRRAKQLSSAQEDGANGTTSLEAPQEAEDEFLSLDDFPDSRANVDLKNDQVPSELLIVPLLPMALVAPDEVEKNSSPLYSHQGEVLASRKDFRMNTCTPHPRGAFMLEPMGMCPIEPVGTCTIPRNQKDARRAEEQPMDVFGCQNPVTVLDFSQQPGESRSPWWTGRAEEGTKEAGIDAVELPEARAPKATVEPEEPRSPHQVGPLRQLS